MDLAHPTTLLLPAGIAALVAWRLYSRVRRMVGRQRLSPVRPWVTACLFPVLIALLLVASLGHPEATAALVAGCAIGVGLALYGLRLTKFEATPNGLFYTPNAHLGIALSALFIVRIGYRAVALFMLGGATGASFAEPQTAFVRSPLTLLIFGTLAGYYVAYAIGLIRWKRGVAKAPAAEPTP